MVLTLEKWFEWVNLADGLEEWLEWVNLADGLDSLEEWLEWVNLADGLEEGLTLQVKPARLILQQEDGAPSKE